mmetsp:Transcript_63377/g.198395  ORF Transcript_63377/g.198395 Transcript_63377/m.198395 type:complete len:613 (+) Transcript_63377:72-1910(+)
MAFKRLSVFLAATALCAAQRSTDCQADAMAGPGRSMLQSRARRSSYHRGVTEEVENLAVHSQRVELHVPATNVTARVQLQEETIRTVRRNTSGEIDSDTLARLERILTDAEKVESGGSTGTGSSAGGSAAGTLKELKEAEAAGGANATDLIRGKDHEKVLNAIEEVSRSETPEDANDKGELVTSKMLEEVSGLPGTPERAAGSRASMTVEGDMLAGSAEELLLLQRANASSGLKWAGTVWQDGTVRYCFHSGIAASSKQAFEDAVQHYRNLVPCITFQKVAVGSDSLETCAQNPAIFVKSGESGCFANVGSPAGWGGSTSVCHLQPGACDSMGIAVHEIGHNLGMVHEQSRPDRDSYVRVEMGNVNPAEAHNYDIDPHGDVTEPYDIMSVMHYGDDTFAASPGTKTMFDLHATGKLMGNRMGLTNADVRQVAKMYGCLSAVSDFKLCTNDKQGCTTESCVCHQQPSSGKEIVKVVSGSCQQCLQRCPTYPTGTDSTCGCPEGYDFGQFDSDGTTFSYCLQTLPPPSTQCTDYRSHCSQFATYCSTSATVNGEAIRDVCLSTCSRCEHYDPTHCSNYESDSTCALYSQYCGNPGVTLNGMKFDDACKQTCGHC